MNASIDEYTTNAVAQRTAWLLSVATNLIGDKGSANLEKNPSPHSFPQQQQWGFVEALPSQRQLRYDTNVSTATTVVISADSSIMEEPSRDHTTVNRSSVGTMSPEEEAELFLKKWRSASFSQDSEIPRRYLQQVEIPNLLQQQRQQKVNCAALPTTTKMVNKKLQVDMSLKPSGVASTQTNEFESVSTRCAGVNTLASVCPTTCTLGMDGAIIAAGEAEGLRNFLRREIVGAIRDDAMVEEAMSLINLIWTCVAELRTKCCTRKPSEISNKFKREIRDVNGGATCKHVIMAVLAGDKQCVYREAGTQTQFNPLHEKAELERNIQDLQDEILALQHVYGEKEANYEHEIARLLQDQNRAEEMIEKLSDDIFELEIAHRAKIADEEKKRLSAEQHLRNRMEEWVKNSLESERVRISSMLERQLSLLDLDSWGDPLPLYGKRTAAQNLFPGSPQNSNCAMRLEKVKTHVSEANPTYFGTPDCRMVEKTIEPLSIQREPREVTTELMKLGDILDAKWSALVLSINAELSKEKLQLQHDFEANLIGIESQLSSIANPVAVGEPLSHIDVDRPRTIDISAVPANIAAQINSLRTQLEEASLFSKGLREALLVQSETHAEAILGIQNERTKALEMLKNELSASQMALRTNEVLHSLTDEETRSRFESVATLEAVSFVTIAKQFAREHALLTHSCDKVSQTSDLLRLKRTGIPVPVIVEETPEHGAPTTARNLSYATPQTNLNLEHAARVTTPRTVRKNVTFADSVAGFSVDTRGKSQDRKVMLIDVPIVVSALGIDQRSSLLELLSICDEALSV